jgi:hypothetical protein
MKNYGYAFENRGYRVQLFGCMYFSCVDTLTKQGSWVKWFLMKTTEDVLLSIGVLFQSVLRP